MTRIKCCLMAEDRKENKNLNIFSFAPETHCYCYSRYDFLRKYYGLKKAYNKVKIIL